MTINKANVRLNLFFGSLLVYAWLSTGFYYDVDDFVKSSFGIALLVLTVFYMLVNAKNVGVKGVSLAYVMVLPFFAVLLVSIIFVSTSELGLDKFNSFAVPVFCLILISSVVLRLYGVELFLESFLKVCAIVLVITLAYKLAFGFFDRTVRYFLNGPIVFGWLMGVAALLAITSPVKKNRLIWFPVFFMATFWSFSKGPILALFIALLIYSVMVLRSPFKTMMIGLVVVALFWLVQGLEIPAIDRMMLVFEKGDDVMEVGSVSARYEMAIASLRVFIENPLLGVGLGNWPDHVQWGGATYPHNVTLELLSELGLLGFLTLLLLLTPAFFRSNYRCVIVFIFLVVAAQFSGDIAYFRIAVFFLLIYYLTSSGVTKYAG